MKLVPVPKKSGLYRDPTTEIIYFRRYKKGYGEIKKSTGTTIIREAEDIAEEFKKRFFNEETKEDANVRRLIEDEAKEFLELQKTKAPSTYSSMEIQFRKHLLPFFGEFFVHEINEVVWERYVSHVKASENPKRKLFNDRKYFTMLMWHLQRQGRIAKVPKFRDSDPEIRAGKVYSDKEIERLIESAGPDLKLQILMGVTQGMRIGEIMSLEWDQIDLDQGIVFLPAEKTKIRKAREFALTKDILAALRLRRESNALGSAVFASPGNPDKTLGRTGNKRSWATCKRNAGVRGRFHDLRHTFLTKAFKVSQNPALVCHYAGLSLEEAERTYLHFTPDDTKEVAELVNFEAPNVVKT